MLSWASRFLATSFASAYVGFGCASVPTTVAELGQGVFLLGVCACLFALILDRPTAP